MALSISIWALFTVAATKYAHILWKQHKDKQREQKKRNMIRYS